MCDDKDGQLLFSQLLVAVECSVDHVPNDSGCDCAHLLQLCSAACLPKLPASIHRHPTPLNHLCLGQKMCYVVFPQDDPSEIQPLTEKSEL